MVRPTSHGYTHAHAPPYPPSLPVGTTCRGTQSETCSPHTRSMSAVLPSERTSRPTSGDVGAAQLAEWAALVKRSSETNAPVPQGQVHVWAQMWTCLFGDEHPRA